MLTAWRAIKLCDETTVVSQTMTLDFFEPQIVLEDEIVANTAYFFYFPKWKEDKKYTCLACPG